MEIPQLDPVPNCPQPCQNVLAGFNQSIEGYAVEVTAEVPKAPNMKRVARKSRKLLRALVAQDPESEGLIDAATTAQDICRTSPQEVMAIFQEPVAAINAMAACALTGCRVKKATPLMSAARHKIG